jgi:hypothetical protein
MKQKKILGCVMIVIVMIVVSNIRFEERDYLSQDISLSKDSLEINSCLED